MDNWMVSERILKRPCASLKACPREERRVYPQAE